MSLPSKELQALWAQKLKDSGFEDIEQKDGNLKEWSNTFFIHHGGTDVIRNNAKQEYYEMAEQFLNEYDEFTSNNMTVWKLHSEGLSVREIAKELKGPSKSTIGTVIKKLSVIMFKKYGVIK